MGELFAQKAVAAFSGEVPFPETMNNWPVDDDKVASSEIVDKGSSRINRKGGASDDQAIGTADQVDGALVGFFREKFAVEGDIGTDHFAADGTYRDCFGTLKDKIFIIFPATGNAVV